jgi:hypothetical protein
VTGISDGVLADIGNNSPLKKESKKRMTLADAGAPDSEN